MIILPLEQHGLTILRLRTADRMTLIGYSH
jgi:hypothetical protein